MKRFAAFAATALLCLAVGSQAQTPPASPHPIAGANRISYDNTTSGLDADDVQEALDELESEGGGGGGVSDGDKTDITVSGSGATWNIDSGAVGGTETDESSLNLDGIDAGSGTTRSGEVAMKISSHNTDCTALTDGVAREQCFEEDSQHTYVCQPSSGGCDSPSEWVRVQPGIFNYTLPPDEAFTSNEIWLTPDLDDAAGVVDGAGADANPFAGALDSSIRTGVLIDPFTNMIDPIHTLSMFNGPGNHATPSLYTSSLVFEYAYDFAQRSLANTTVEYYWQFKPATHLIAFSSGSGSIAAATNVVFSDGATCRPATPNSTSMGATSLRMHCVDHDPPAVAATISSGCSGCTGTVSAVTEDLAWRPFFWTLYTGGTVAPSVDIDFRRRNSAAGGTTPMCWLSGQNGDNILHLGKCGYLSTDANPSRLSIPAVSNLRSYGLVVGTGDIGIDTSNSSTYNGGMSHEITTHTLGPQIAYAGSTGAGIPEYLGPVETSCFTQGATNATTDDNTVVPLSWWQPVTIVAMGCRNMVAAPATDAVLTLQDQGGTDITLASTLTCADNTAVMAFVTTSTNDADSILTSGEGLQVDVTTASTTDSDDHIVCFAYKKTAQ